MTELYSEQLLGEIKQILEDTMKIHQNMEIKRTEMYMDLMNLLKDIKKNQETPLITKQDVPKDGPSM